MTQPVHSWKFIDQSATFVLTNPHHTSYLYFPLVNETGMMSSITPTLHGDVKTGHNEFLTSPVSVEDLHNTRAGRNFWVFTNEHGPWSATGNSAAQISGAVKDDHVSLTAGLLWHRVRRENHLIGIRAETTSFVPMDHNAVELMQVQLTNIGTTPLTFSPTAAIPIYGRSADNLRDHRHVTSLLHRIETQRYGVQVCPTLSFDERGHVANTTTYGVFGISSTGEHPIGFIPAIEDFIGEGGNLAWPEAVLHTENVPSELAGHILHGYEAIGALRFADTTLLPNEQVGFILVLAIGSGDQNGSALIEAYGSDERLLKSLETCQSQWQQKATAITVKTGEADFDLWMRWVSIQPVLRRLFGNSFLPYHDYGRGGRGWRDLWQDCLALLLTEPDSVPELLHSSYGGVRIDGSNATIIGSRPGEFIADRNNIPRVWMDHGAWPLLTTQLYIDQTGDIDFLLREQAYFQDHHLHRCTQQDASWIGGVELKTSTGNTYQGSILEHILVQNLTAFFNVGEHNVIRLEGADWNDGMDMAPNRGESVAFTALYASNLRDLGKLVLELAEHGTSEFTLATELKLLLDTLDAPLDYNDIQCKLRRLEAYFAATQPSISGERVLISAEELARDLEKKANWLFEHLRQQEWITNKAGFSWYNGYYDEDGQRVEGDHPNGVRMTLTGQVFTIMGGVATDTQVGQILQAANTYLHEPSMAGYRLNSDFKEVKHNLGRCFGFAFGHKENGAMFSHMAIMFANALYQRGFVNIGHQIITDIYRHCRNFEVSRMYPGIPEYINARGRGMYPYLTGSASWLLLTIVTQVYGVQGNMGNLVLEPKLVRDQFDDQGSASIQLPFADRQLRIEYRNPNGLDYGDYVIKSAMINNQSVPHENHQTYVKFQREVILKLPSADMNDILIELGNA